METIAVGSWRITVHREATAKVYRGLQGDPERCGCRECRNFVAAREVVYPKVFQELLEHLGIDYRKESEVYHFCRLQNGSHLYGGCYHCIGTVEATGEGGSRDHICLDPARPDFRLTVGSCRALAPDDFGDEELVELTFEVEVPWVLPGSEPE